MILDIAYGIESVEYVLLCVEVHSLSCVMDFYDDGCFGLGYRDCYDSVFLRVLECVGNQVDKDLFHLVAVYPQVKGLYV